MARPLILILEDDKSICEIMAEILSFEGFDSIRAGNGTAGVNALKQCVELPILIISDLMMPGMNGIEFRLWQQGQPKFRRIPFILLTAAQNAKLPDGIGEIGLLKKPLDLDIFLEGVRAEINRIQV